MKRNRPQIDKKNSIKKIQNASDTSSTIRLQTRNNDATGASTINLDEYTSEDLVRADYSDKKNHEWIEIFQKYWVVATSIVGIFFYVIWNASSLNSKVTRIDEDMNNTKSSVDQLKLNDAKASIKIEQIEKNVERLTTQKQDRKLQ